MFGMSRDSKCVCIGRRDDISVGTSWNRCNVPVEVIEGGIGIRHPTEAFPHSGSSAFKGIIGSAKGGTEFFAGWAYVCFPDRIIYELCALQITAGIHISFFISGVHAERITAELSWHRTEWTAEAAPPPLLELSGIQIC